MIQLKICLLGAYAVGKTSLAARFVRGIFSDKYLATLGVKIDRKMVRYRDERVKLMLWDMAGEDEFAKVNMTYLRGASGYLLVIDGTRRVTLDQAGILQQRVLHTLGKMPHLVLVNKCDAESRWEIRGADIRDMTAQGWLVRQTSALTGDGVEEAFEALVKLILDARAEETGS